jgi:hypothetical protein
MQLRGLLLLVNISHNISATSAISAQRIHNKKPQQKPKTNSTRNEEKKKKKRHLGGMKM